MGSHLILGNMHTQSRSLRYKTHKYRLQARGLLGYERAQFTLSPPLIDRCLFSATMKKCVNSEWKEVRLCERSDTCD